MTRAPSAAIARVGLWALVALTAGCYPSNVLDTSLRAVEIEAPDVDDWAPVARDQFPGTYASESIFGDAAASLLDVRYVFRDNGTYSGAALVVGESGLEYQTLTGTWSISDSGSTLVLDDRAPGFSLGMHENRIRVASDAGTVILERIELR